MRGVYIAQDSFSATSAKTLMLLETPSDLVMELLSVDVTNEDNDTAEQIDVGIYHVTTKGSPTGTSVTPAKTEQGDQASSVTCTSNLSAEPTTYESVAVDRKGTTNLAGYHFIPREEEKVYVSPSKLIGIKLVTAIASTTLAVQVKFREIGG